MTIKDIEDIEKWVIKNCELIPLDGSVDIYITKKGIITMPKYGKRSLSVLNQLHPDLQRLMKEVIKHVDISLIYGYRGKAAQNAAHNAGKSKLKWPLSKHNKRPSFAVDWMPYPNSERVEDYYFIAGIIKGIALMMGIGIRAGADFNGNGGVTDKGDGWDSGHTELVVR